MATTSAMGYYDKARWGEYDYDGDYEERQWLQLRSGPAPGKSNSAAKVYGSVSPQRIAAQGFTGSPQALPYLDQIQSAFGKHDVSGVSAFISGPATSASEALNAEAYAMGTAVAFRDNPSLHTAAHEAAHVVQQRAGVSLSSGVGSAGDAYERHADRVADAVVAGQSAEAILDQMAGPGGGGVAVQRLEAEPDSTAEASDASDASDGSDASDAEAKTEGDKKKDDDPKKKAKDKQESSTATWKGPAGGKVAVIYFRTGKTRINSSGRKAIETIVAALGELEAGQSVSITLVGFTDHRGEENFNYNLAGRRAEVVEKKLAGVPNVRTEVESRGESEASQSEDADGLAKDRRVEVHVSSFEEPPAPDFEMEFEEEPKPDPGKPTPSPAPAPTPDQARERAAEIVLEMPEIYGTIRHHYGRMNRARDMSAPKKRPTADKVVWDTFVKFLARKGGDDFGMAEWKEQELDDKFIRETFAESPAEIRRQFAHIRALDRELRKLSPHLTPADRAAIETLREQARDYDPLRSFLR